MGALIVLPAMIVGLALGCGLVCATYGPRFVARIWPRLAIPFLVVLAVMWLFGFLPRASHDRIWSGFLLLALAGLLSSAATWPLRKRAAGGLLLAVDRGTGQTLDFVSAAIWLLIGVTELSGMRASSSSPLSPAICVALGVYALFSGLRGREVRENGFLRFGSLLKWQQIASYEWESEDTLSLSVRGRWSILGPVIWRIPPRQKEAMQQILAQRFPGGPAAAGGSA